MNKIDKLPRPDNPEKGHDTGCGNASCPTCQYYAGFEDAIDADHELLASYRPMRTVEEIVPQLSKAICSAMEQVQVNDRPTIIINWDEATKTLHAFLYGELGGDQ